MKLISKSHYVPRYRGYRVAMALVTIADGVVNLFVAPFGYTSNVLAEFSAYNLRKDVERRRASREAKKAVLGE